MDRETSHCDHCGVVRPVSPRMSRQRRWFDDKFGPYREHRRVRTSRLKRCANSHLHDALRAFGPTVPLQMADQSRTVIERPEEDRRHPFSAGAEDLARARVRVPVPQTAHVFSLITAHLARQQPALCSLDSFAASTSTDALKHGVINAFARGSLPVPGSVGAGELTCVPS
jgi:hypothetical protein